MWYSAAQHSLVEFMINDDALCTPCCHEQHGKPPNFITAEMI